MKETKPMPTLSLNSENDMNAIISMVFDKGDVLTTEREKINRSANVLKASVLDSLNKLEVILHVEDKESRKKLRSRIIGTSDERVMLEKGLSIPIRCIHVIEFPQ